MSKAKTYTTSMEVDILDAEGYETGRTALVYLLIGQDIDTSYGADADGKRGILRVEYEILKSWVEEDDLENMTAQEAIEVINIAEREFRKGNPHFS